MEIHQNLGLKRLSTSAYRLTVNTNDRFIGLAIIDCDFGLWPLQTNKVAKETVDLKAGVD